MALQLQTKLDILEYFQRGTVVGQGSNETQPRFGFEYLSLAAVNFATDPEKKW